jgi:UDP-2,3-diacylglucosamine pyrophosphatase LpxH
MTDWHTFVVSDLHIGSAYFHRRLFLRFIDTLKPGTTLVFNGDTIDTPRKELDAADVEVLDRIRKLAEKVSIVWVPGNHDPRHQPLQVDGITYIDTYHVDKRIVVMHGHQFDKGSLHRQLFIEAFRMFYRLSTRFSGEHVHEAEFAKSWKFLYNYLRRKVRTRAVNYAREHGYSAVACGHVHYAEDSDSSGVRYLNTGAWTESATFCVCISDDSIELHSIYDLVGK